MEKIEENDRDIIFLGDIHGNFSKIIKKIKRLGITNKIIIQVGDFGIGFTSYDGERLENLNTFLNEIKCTMYVIRGNHDDPIYFNGDYKYSNLHLTPDYTILTCGGKNILLVGGAVSIDRESRKENDKLSIITSNGETPKTYWVDEPFVLNREFLTNVRGVNVVVTHSAPHFCMPTNDMSNTYNSHGSMVEHYAFYDPTLKNDLNRERIGLTSMFNILKENNNIENWYYGHFHNSFVGEYESTKFTLLNIDEFL